jgi:signal transduction histidine kinase
MVPTYIIVYVGVSSFATLFATANLYRLLFIFNWIWNKKITDSLNKRVKYDEIMLIAKRVEEAIETTRQTARGLYPVTLEKGGLVTALREMATIIKTNYGINCIINHQGLDTCQDIRISIQIYYVAVEAVNNAIRHSNVINIIINIIINDNKLELIIESEGEIKSRKKSDDGIGMKIMQYRANTIGAALTTEFTKQGYRIILTAHCD